MEPNRAAEPQVRPRVVQRECGGWLAISPTWSRFSVAVTAATESEAADAFRVEFERWVLIVDGTVQKNT